MTSTGTRSALDRELQLVRDNILRMGSLVDQAISRAYDAIYKHEPGLAQLVINEDKAINELRNRSEHEVTSTMALQQPMAHDLRVLVASLMISNELERMGDHAVGIARTVLRYQSHPTFDMPTQVADMVDILRRMLRQSMDSYIEENVPLARETAELDDRIDSLYQDLFNQMVSAMGKGECSVERGTYVLWTGHNLERIGDRITNICERAIYTSTGRPSRSLNVKPDEQLDED